MKSIHIRLDEDLSISPKSGMVYECGGGGGIIILPSAGGSIPGGGIFPFFIRVVLRRTLVTMSPSELLLLHPLSLSIASLEDGCIPLLEKDTLTGGLLRTSANCLMGRMTRPHIPTGMLEAPTAQY